MKTMTTVEALQLLLDLERKEHWSWSAVSQIKKLSKFFNITPDEVIGLISPGGTFELAVAWLNKNKPRKQAVAS